MDTVRIDFACNDPDTGIFAGRVCKIAMPDGLLELTCNNWNILSFRGCPAFRYGDGWISLSGRRWPIVRSKAWLGNWCWDGVWFRDQVARQFLVWLHGTKKFDCESGEMRLANSWDLDEPLDLEPQKEHPQGLGRLLAKAMLSEQRA